VGVNDVKKPLRIDSLHIAATWNDVQVVD